MSSERKIKVCTFRVRKMLDFELDQRAKKVVIPFVKSVQQNNF